MGSSGQFFHPRARTRAMAKILLTIRAVLATAAMSACSSAAAQTQTRCVRENDRAVNCTTRPLAPPLNGYVDALGASQRLVPSYQDQERNRQQIEQLRLQNEMMRRQLEVQAAPSYDQKQCRRSAKGAIDAGDLVLARDVLNACAGGH